MSGRFKLSPAGLATVRPTLEMSENKPAAPPRQRFESLPVWQDPPAVALAVLIRQLEQRQPADVAGYYFRLARQGEGQPDSVSYGLVHRMKTGQLRAFKHEVIAAREPMIISDSDIDPRNSNVDGPADDLLADIDGYLGRGFQVVNQLGRLMRSGPHRGAVYSPLTGVS